LDHELPSPIRNTELLLTGAWHAYTPPNYEGRVVLFLASGRPPEYAADITLGWKTCAAKSLELQTVPGDHRSLLHPPFVSTLAKKLTRYLADAEAVGEAGT
jgi:thioesterase domain-containing protein